MPRLLFALLASVLICWSGIALTESQISAPLSLSHARVAIQQLGQRQFAIDGNRYLVPTPKVIRVKRPNFFEVEVEIVPLPKQRN